MTAAPPEPPDAAFAVELPPAPYPGLRPFDTDEWPIFFGREQMTDAVIKRVLDQHLVVVHGDSGCGKSSLIRAGVLAQLEHERARSGVRWRTGHMLPRDAPLKNLATALARLRGDQDVPDAVHEIHRILNFGTDAPAALAALLCQDEGDNICILVDQFEELFSFARKHGREEAQLLVDFLAGLQKQPPPGLYALVTMRSEFLGVCARFEGLAEAVNQTQYLLPQMDRSALMRAIREPAALYDGEVSRELAERLINDAGGGQDQLPLIQHGLMLLWRHKVGGPSGLEDAAPSSGLAEAPASYRGHGGRRWRLGPEDYHASGGLAALLSAHADEVMAEAVRDPRTGQADPEREKAVEHLFRALTDINAEGQAVRRPQTFAELLAVTGSDERVLRGIIAPFRAPGVSFLSPHHAAPLGPGTLIDIGHEALIRCWQKISAEKGGWLQKEFQDGLIWKSLRLQAEEGGLLAAVATATRDDWLRTLPSPGWCQRYGGGWADVQALMERSRAARDAEQHRRQELEEARRREAEERAQRAEEARLAAARLAEARQQIATEQQQRAEAEHEKAIEAEVGRRRANRLAIVAGTFAVLAFIAACAGMVSWWQAKAAKDDLQTALDQLTTTEIKAQVGDSLYRSEQARKWLGEGLPVTAMQLALAGLPENPQDATPEARRWVAETAGALIEAMGGERSELKALPGHEGAVWTARFSPDGTRIVSGSSDNTVRVWDAIGLEELLVLEGHRQQVLGAAFAPDGSRIVSTSDDRTIRLWDAARGAQLQILEGHEEWVQAAVFSPDGTRIASASGDRTVRVWDAASGAELMVLRGHEDRVLAVAFSPDGARIASASGDATVRLWDARTGAAQRILRGHQGPVWAAAFSPDGAQIVSAGEDRTVRTWEAGTGRQLLELNGHRQWIWAAAFSPDGARIVTGSRDNTLRLWDATTGAELSILRGHSSWVRAAAFSPDGERIVSASQDKTIRLWDPDGSRQTVIMNGLEGEVRSVAFSPDGTRIVTATSAPTVQVWDAASGEELRVLKGHEGEVGTAAFAPDGARIVSASADGTIRLWDPASGRELEVLRGHDSAVQSAAFSPDGTRIVSASADATVRVWDASSGAELQVLRGHAGWVWTAAFSPDGAWIVSGSGDGTVRIWDAASGAELQVLKGHGGWVRAASFAPDGTRILSAAIDGTVRVWQPESGAEPLVLRGHDDWVWSAVFSADGARIASAASDNTVRIWDAATGEALLVLRAHTAPVWTASFSPDGERIVSGGEDRTVRVTWIGRSKQQLLDTAQARLPRELTEEERRRFHFAVE